MSDNNRDFDTQVDVQAEAALDALLEGHQSGLRAVLGSALDTRAGLAQLGRRGQVFRTQVLLEDECLGDESVFSSVRGSRKTMPSSSLEGVLAAIEEEQGSIKQFLVDADRRERSFLRRTPKGASQSPYTALIVTCIELERIGDRLNRNRVTKDSAGPEFAEAQAVLQGQLAVWGQKTMGKHSDREAELFNHFLRRFDRVKTLEKLVIRLFEDTDTTALQFN
ncbi:hypothetical protein OG264_39565 (plasmid) [Streptomyces xanthophaeus]|uniref:hypothetical protein n=1 Tax=Streptomyces xanthophaeus TaxID=67385 RepID=UPI002F90F4E6|nr:hypothetical protein OG264_39720 [Streptomyces xanthophaeus]WST27633.1 hypothetical protein OG264_39565 [Streptomyces xanthophaeus]WST65999.1 hypothetical protein OG605_41045 [Streptomyces xanthophaeus]WST66027.1 hypothetical protein OG605_40890 [Streptomyces xanthophaeus]